MTAFVTDSFTDSNGTIITSHTGELGATWTALTGSGLVPTIQGNAVDPGTGVAANALYYASGVPPTADYTVTADVLYNGSTSVPGGPAGRMSTSAQTGYFGILFNSINSPFDKFALFKYVTGTLTKIAGTGTTPTITSGVTYRITLDLQGTTVALRVQRLSDNNWLNSSGSWQSGQTNCLSVTDTDITATGRAGFWAARTPATPSTLLSIDTDDLGVASAVTLTGPASGSVGSASSNFTVGANGTITGTVVVTPSDGGAGGTFTPTTVSISSGTPTGTFTYNAASSGTKTISVTNNGSLSNPTALSYLASSGGGTLSVTHQQLFWSPYNWYSDGAGAMADTNVKAASTYAQSNNPGAYLKFRVQLASTGNVTISLDNAHLSTITAGEFPQISVSRDGQAPVLTQLSGTTTQVITLASSLAAGTYDFCVLFQAVGLTSGGDRWTTPRESVKITAVAIPSDATLLAARLRAGRMIVYGDSITEGLHNKGTTLAVADQDAGYTWAHMVAASLDCEVGIIGFGGQGWSDTGVGNVPAFSSSWDLYSAGRSRLASGLLVPTPNRVLLAHGENDTTGGSLSTTITSTLAAIRTAAGGDAAISVLVPFTGKIQSDILAATLPALTAVVDSQSTGADGSHLVYYPGYQSPLHPSIAGSAYLAGRLANLIDNLAQGSAIGTRTVQITLTTNGTTPAASLTGLKWAWFDSTDPSSFAAPTDRGSIESTDGSGVLNISVRSALASGGVGWLIITNSDGTTTQSPPHKAFSGPIEVI